MGGRYELVYEGITWTVKLFRDGIYVDEIAGLTRREALDLGAGWFSGDLSCVDQRAGVGIHQAIPVNGRDRRAQRRAEAA